MVWIERVVLFLPLPWAPYTRILTFKDIHTIPREAPSVSDKERVKRTSSREA